MKNQFLPVSFILLSNLFLSSVSTASVVYSYQGNFFDSFTTPSFHDNSMNISGSFQVASELPIDSFFVDLNSDIENYSFNDGIFTYNKTNSILTSALFSTDSQGNISKWLFNLVSYPVTDPAGDPAVFALKTEVVSGTFVNNDTASIWPCSVGSCSSTDPGVLSGKTINNPGVWSVSAVPVPAAIWLFGSGLIGLIGIAKKKKNT